MTAYIKYDGLEPLLKKLTKLSQLKYVIAAIKAAAAHVKGKADDYPPSTIANSPDNPTGRWYERGYGPKWQTRSGVHGRKTSETLGRRWAIKIEDHGLTAIIGNNVSYAPFVHSREEQAGFHKDRGWKTVEDVAEEETPVVLDFLHQEIDRAIKE